MGGGPDPYASSTAAAKLRRAGALNRSPSIACLDIDSTLTGDPAAANAVRGLLEDAGYVVMFNTSRTEEMVMRGASRERSRLARPSVKAGHDGNRRIEAPPETVEPAGLLDPDVVAGSTGTQVYVRQLDGTYLSDDGFHKRFGEAPTAWRGRALSVLDEARRSGCEVHLAAIEDAEAYASGAADVAPPEYRIQIEFDSLPEKRRFVACFAGIRTRALAEGRPWNLRFTDDSRPDSAAFKGFVMPHGGGKVRAAERVIGCVARSAGVDRSSMRLLFTGDSFPDLAMGLLGGLGTQATFLLAGGSRLVDGLTSPDVAEFAGEPLGAVRRRLSPLGRGRYRFRLPFADCGTRTMIVADEVWPQEREVRSVLRYLQGEMG